MLNFLKSSTKSLKLHNSADTLPFAQWVYYQKTKDLRWLMKLNPSVKNTFELPKIKSKDEQVLANAFQEILYTLKNHDIHILSAYRKWKSEYILIKKERLSNKIRSLENMQPLRVSYYNFTKAVYSYLSSLQDNYKIEITKYSVNAKAFSILEQVYADDNKQTPEILNVIFDELKEFYSIEEYISVIDKYVDNNDLSVMFLNENFFKMYFVEENIILTEPINFADNLKDRFLKLKIAQKYYDVIANLFDMQNLKAKISTDSDMWKEINIVKSELHEFDIWAVTLAEYMSKVEVLKAKQDSIDKLNKKTQSA